MSFHHTINLDRVYIDPTSRSKTAVFLKISQLLSQSHLGLDLQELFDAYWKRESMGSTAIGQGICIPHIRTRAITKPLSCVIRLLNPIDFGAEDKQPVNLVIGLLVPQEQVDQHLQLLSAIIKQVQTPSFRETYRQMTSKEELYSLFVGKPHHEELLV